MSGREKYTRISDRVEETGEYELVLPLDTLILGVLEKEGSTFGGLYEIGTPAPEIIKKLSLDGKMKASQVGSRLNTLRMQGLAKRVRLLGAKSGWGWQRTGAGDVLLAKMKAEEEGQ